MATTKRRIAAHKGGRTARAPEARIRPQTLAAIRATMQQRDKSFGDLLEEQYGDDTMNHTPPQFDDNGYARGAYCVVDLDLVLVVADNFDTYSAAKNWMDANNPDGIDLQVQQTAS